MDPHALDEIVHSATVNEQIVGAVVLVAQDGEVVYSRAAGYADREAGTPMRVDHLFRYSSLTKPIVALTTMALAERGVLDVSRPVTRWLPHFRPALPDGSRPDITVDHLLTHTSGLAYGFGLATDEYARLGISDGLDRSSISLAEEVERVGRSTLQFAPGSSWAYSVAYEVLGGLIERVTSARLPDVVRELVTGPLGMTRAAFAITPTSDLATAYSDGSPQPERMREDVPVLGSEGGEIWMSPERIHDAGQFPSGGAGMVGDAREFMTLLEAVRTDGGGVVSAETLAAMRAPRVTRPVAPGVSGAFGRGWAVVTDGEPSPLSAGSLQWGGVFGHAWAIDPERRTSVVQLTNTAIAGMAGSFPDAVLAAAL